MIDLYAISCAAAAILSDADAKRREKMGLPPPDAPAPATFKDKCLDILCVAFLVMPFFLIPFVIFSAMYIFIRLYF